MKWRIRRLVTGDEARFVPFLGNWISDQPVDIHFDWLYRGNPHGNAITWLASHAATDRIVGCTSAFPRRMIFNGRPVLGCFGGDAFVDPEFRRRGIAQSLHEFGVEDMRQLEIECLYGFPVPANLRAFLRAGALAPCDYHRFRLQLNANSIVRSLGLGPFSQMAVAIINPAVNFYLDSKIFRNAPKGRLQIVRTFDSSVDDLFESVAQKFGICCVRDAAYLNWRFSHHPFIRSTNVIWKDDDKLLAYAVLDLRTEQCKILDYFVRDNVKFAIKFLASLAHFARDNGKESISLNLYAQGRIANTFRKAGFRSAGKGVRFMVHTTHDPEKDKVFNNPDEWYLMPGDRDIG